MHVVADTVEKILGADFELANAFWGQARGTARQAAGRLLAEIPGYPRGNLSGTSIEFGRRFLDTCGSSWYIDSDHLEGNLPEHRSALDHPRVLYGAGISQALRALRSVQHDLPASSRLNLLANCSDGRTSWGHHLNILVTRKALDDLLHRKPHQAAFFATHLVTSVLYTGQGMVGAGNGRSACAYQLSQRADWFETFFGQQTMFQRPLINQRDEPHAEHSLARLHVIYFDMVLAPVANILKAGTTQLVLAMIEAGWIDPAICLDDPLADASEISRDLRLRRQLRTSTRGRRMTAVEIQGALASLAAEFVASGAAEGVVPSSQEIVALWTETLDLLRRREVEALARRCDAWLKLLLLGRRRGKRRLAWTSNEMRVADSLYASLDPDVSLFFGAANSGFVERMPDEDTVERCCFEPPEDTRAYFRAHALRRYGNAVSSLDWSFINFVVPGPRDWCSITKVPLRDPRGFSRAETENLFTAALPLEEFVAKAREFADSPSTPAANNGRSAAPHVK